MKYLNFKSEYNNNPIIKIEPSGDKLFAGDEEIINELKQIKSGVIAFETYPGVDLPVLLNQLIKPLKADRVILIEDHAKSPEKLEQMLARNLTDDRVFGLYSHHTIEDFYELDQIETLVQELNNSQGLTIVYGFGAHLISADYLIPVSLSRWEIQLRYRAGAANFRAHNYDEEILRKYKRGYFIEWRVADRVKEKTYPKAAYVIDYNRLEQPVMMTKADYFQALKAMTKRPFRMVPYFDPGVWGGQWMKEVCNLDPTKVNYAWSFDGLPEENSFKMSFGHKVIEFPAQDIVLFEPEALMGAHVYARFGKKFPIRFDLLDTMDGGNLSLQVHPRAEYAFDVFGMPYTQDESYYLLDAEADGVIYLGFKNDADIEAFKTDLRRAEKGEISFDVDRYINTFKAKKHDHFSIPAGTVHCSARNTMVLEISASTYIHTFKLWDWDRVNLDGKPRPVHLDHGFNNMRPDFNYDYAVKHLINPFIKLDEHAEITGLTERHFLKTIRYTFQKPYEIFTEGVIVGTLVEGKKARIFAPNNEFEPMEINYAETFVIPAGIKSFFVEALDNTEMMIITARVKNG